MPNIIATLKKNTMLVALILVMLLFEALIQYNNKGSLFVPRNITNIIFQNGYVIILATGMLLCILTGGNIDLSVGSMVALVAAIGATLTFTYKVNFYLGVVICLITGLILGAWQAFWIAYIRIPPFIVTLAGMLAFRGLTNVILGGQFISPLNANFTKYFASYLTGFGGAATEAGAPDTKLIFSIAVGAIICAVVAAITVYGRINKIRKKYEADSAVATTVRLVIICGIVMGVFYSFGRDRGVPVLLILLGIVVLAYYYFTSKTVPGRYLYAMGGNEKAARLSGVNTNGVMFFAYANMGFLSAVAALVCMARFNMSNPTLGTSFELDAIGACFIGGASAYGGVGTVGGTIIGTILMGVLNNGMNILGVDQNWQQAVKGSVLLAAVIFDVLSKKRKNAA